MPQKSHRQKRREAAEKRRRQALKKIGSGFGHSLAGYYDPPESRHFDARPKKASYPDEVKSRVEKGLVQKAKAVTRMEQYKKVRKAIETAEKKGALTKEQAGRIRAELKPFEEGLKSIEAPKLSIAEQLRRKRKPVREKVYVFERRLGTVEKAIKPWAEKIMKEAEEKGKPISFWEAENRAYRNYYLKARGYEPLFDAFFRYSKRAIRQLERKSHNFFSAVTPETIERAQRYHNWKTFHVGMNKLRRKWGDKNIEALVRMVKNSKRFGVEFRDFRPKKGHVEIWFSRPSTPKESGVLGTRYQDRIELVAIEAMKGGKITQVGGTLKYDKYAAQVDADFGYSTDWEAFDQQPAQVKEHLRIMTWLNRLIEGKPMY